MPVANNRSREAFSDRVVQMILDYSKSIFRISIPVTIALYAYLLYGLFTGQLVNVPHMPQAEQARIIENIDRVSLLLNISLIALLVTACIHYYEAIGVAYLFVVMAAALAYGLQYCVHTLFASEAAHYVAGNVSAMTLHEIWQTGVFFGIAGVALIVRHMLFRIVYGRRTTLAKWFSERARFAKRRLPR